eukprot:CAMPEP_0176071988 /NCGR_PEP_ID=MMETSP0120_2-20121206/35958_1 /TAXON_ID=160619 /ORGANISM="Kryptoperidinium foliaceum, Strain CCMP 1326" /LENGTH=452 /DNA_ID=CAMNT_0017405649 /DNA_START=65 /DNA_END=1423 /DNA_ORIENTATION=+
MASTSAAYDDYLERKMRSVLETLVEALLMEKPEDVSRFCIEWLARWHRQHDPEEEELSRLRAERNILADRKTELETMLRSAPGGAAASAQAASQEPASGPATAEPAGASSPAASDAPAAAEGSDKPDADGGAAASGESPEDAAELAKVENMKGKDRRTGVSAPAIDQDRMKDWKRPHYEKTQEARERIKGIIKTNDKLQVLFGHLTEQAIYDVIDAMKPESIEAGTNLINQGEEGTFFYIVDDGSFDVFVKRGDDPPGKVLEYGPGSMFGELALMYNAPRAATVTATSSSRVWALDRESFQMMLATAENTKKSTHEEFLYKIELFKHMTKYEICKLSDLLEPELFEDGEEIMKQGDKGEACYILEDGQAKAYIQGEQGEVEVKHYTTPGEFFGEVALLTNEPRRATVRAEGQGCSVLTLKTEDFDTVMGPIKNTLEKNIDLYPNYAQFITKE